MHKGNIYVEQAIGADFYWQNAQTHPQMIDLVYDNYGKFLEKILRRITPLEYQIVIHKEGSIKYPAASERKQSSSILVDDFKIYAGVLEAACSVNAKAYSLLNWMLSLPYHRKVPSQTRNRNGGADARLKPIYEVNIKRLDTIQQRSQY